MPKQHSITEARTNLTEIVNQAEAGAEIELTRRGKPVAVLISHRRLERLRRDRREFVDAFRAFLRKHSPGDIGIDAALLKSAREKSVGCKISL